MKHIFTLFLNQKRRYGGMLAEQMLVFFVLLFCFVVVGEKIAQYFSPGILNTKNTVKCMLLPVSPSEYLSSSELQQKMDRVVEKVRKSSMVIAFGKSKWLVPYTCPEEMYLSDSIQIGTRKIHVFLKFADNYMNQVFQLQMEEGEWLTDELLEDGSCPAVITSQLMQELGWSRGIGKRIHYKGTVFTIVGIVTGIKQEPLKASRPTMIVPNRIQPDQWFEYMVRVKEGETDNFRNLMNKEFNLMMGEERAIVTDIAGTTRDLVEGQIHIGSVQLNLIDTAGIRESNDKIEQIGIEKSQEKLKDAKLVLLVFDGSKELDEEDKQLLELTKDKMRLIIYNKLDKTEADKDGIWISASNKEIQPLIDALENLYQNDLLKEDPLLSNERQIGLLNLAKEDMLRAKEAMNRMVEPDLIEIDIQAAHDHLKEILGEVHREDLLDTLFSKFCLGK